MKTLPVMNGARTTRPERGSSASTPAARTPYGMMILGVFLLAGSLFIASSALNSPSQAQTPSAEQGNGNGNRFARRAVAVAYIDVEGGVINLAPVLSGRVTTLPIAEGKKVKKGDLLLQLDDTVAKVQVAEATVALEVAKEKLVQAKKLVTQHQQKMIMQRAAVEAAKKKKAAAQAQANKVDRLYKQGVHGAAEDVEAANSLVAEADAGIKAAEEQLELIKTMDPESAIRLAGLDVKAKSEQLEKAKVAVRECKVLAPLDGQILRTLVNVGEIYAPGFKPAFHFWPDKPLIVRAEVEQEFASKLAVGQKATIEDELTNNGLQWTGKVTSVSPWYAQRREIILEPRQFNDMRTLEVIIHLDPLKYPLRINQRVRVQIDGQE